MPPPKSAKAKKSEQRRIEKNTPKYIEGVGHRQCEFPAIPELKDGMRTQPATEDLRTFVKDELICIRFPGTKDIVSGKYIRKVDKFSHEVSRGAGSSTPPWYDIGKFKSALPEMAVQHVAEAKKLSPEAQALILSGIVPKKQVGTRRRKTRRRRRTTSRA